MVENLKSLYKIITKSKELPVYLILIVFLILYISIVVANHYYFRTNCWDYGVYNNAFWDYAHFRINLNPIYEPPGVNFLQDHMSFIMFILAPLYWVLNWITGSYSLLIIQEIIVVIGGYYVYLLIKFKSQDHLIAIFALIHYFVLQGHFGIFSSDFNITTVGASLVPLFLYFFEKEKYISATFFFLVVLISKESMSLWLTFISISLLLIYFKEKSKVKYCLLYAFISILYFIFIFKFLIPFFEDPNRPYWGFAYSALGNNINEAFVFIIKHPWRTFQMLYVNHLSNPMFNRVKASFYEVFLYSGGLLLLYRPKYLIMFVPLIAQKMLNDNPDRWGLNWHYTIEIVSILSICIFLIINTIKYKIVKYLLSIIVCFSSAYITISMFNIKNRTNYSYSIEKENFLSKNMFTSGYKVQNARKMHKYLKIIPSDAKVVASSLIVPHIAQREFIYLFPHVRDAEYILLFDFDYYPLSKAKFEKELESYINNKDWSTVVQDAPLYIFHRNKQ